MFAFQDMMLLRLALLSALLVVLVHSIDIDLVVDMDGRSVIINGTRELILSGSVHYARVLPADWERVFLLAKEMHLIFKTQLLSLILKRCVIQILNSIEFSLIAHN